MLAKQLFIDEVFLILLPKSRFASLLLCPEKLQELMSDAYLEAAVETVILQERRWNEADPICQLNFPDRLKSLH